MKKIINGKVYDTDTAKRKGVYNHSCPNDFNYFSELLYLKKTGEYFLHGEGGPASKYVRSAGQNSWSGGEQIIPLSYNAAKEWAEERLDADEYEAIFGAIQEGEGKEPMTIYLPSELAAEIRMEAQKAEMGVSAWLTERLME